MKNKALTFLIGKYKKLCLYLTDFDVIMVFVYSRKSRCFNMLEVSIPYSFNENTMYSFIESVIDEKMIPKDNIIKFDFRNLNFIEPAGVTILTNLVEWLKRRKVRVEFTYPKDTNQEPTKGIKYLDDSMFFNHYLKENLTSNPNVRITTMPLEFIAYDASYGWLDRDFIPWLSGRLNISNSSLGEIKTCFGEIFNNIRDHADENTGCIFAQHYPNKDKIQISISDFGIGIPNNIRKVYPGISDSTALERAIEEGVSSKSTPKNRGAGLKTLLQNVVVNYGGTVQIRSYSGILSVEGNNSDGLVVNCSEVIQKYPGTFIEITFNTNNFYNLPDEEEFEWD